MSDMPRQKPPHLYRERSRHGKYAWRVRVGHGLRTTIKAEYGTEEFWQEYRSALADAPPPVKTIAKSNTLSWAIERYMASSAWAKLAQATRSKREGIFRPMIELAGDQPLTKITHNTIRAGRERRKDKPHVANEYMKAVRGLFGWLADPNGGSVIAINPCTGIKTLPNPNKEGYHTWEETEMAKFEQFWAIGTRERMVFDIARFTGLARGDVIRLGKQHVRGGVITTGMVKHRGDDVVYPLMLPALAASIAATKCGDLSYLVNEHGARYTPGGFSNWFKVACQKAGLPDCCVFHGVRKYVATLLAEEGASNSYLKAALGWSSDAMANHYTRKANRKKLGAKAFNLLARAQAKNK